MSLNPTAGEHIAMSATLLDRETVVPPSNSLRPFDAFALPHDRTNQGPMPIEIPPELFRRTEAHKQLLRTQEAISRFVSMTAQDYRSVSEASLYLLASQIMTEIRRPDLAREFEALAIEAVKTAATAAPLRVHKPKVKKRAPRAEPPDQSTRLHRRPADGPEKHEK